MTNIQMTTEGPILTIKIYTSQKFGPSKSGKTTIVASTQGNQKVPGTDIVLGLNAYKR